MLKPDFTRYSLALVKDEKIIFSSQKSGLRPLVECISKFRGKEGNCTLHDKVIGLAAARLIVYGGFISGVVAGAASKKAKDFLEKEGISIKSKKVVESILNKDKTGICPGEIKAGQVESNEGLFLHFKGIFSN